ncbi:MAG: hypothetical protein AB1894_21070 [Chloroflexota bacterium]
MGRYSKYSTEGQMASRPWTVHPIWRGIGLILIILIPIMSFAGAVELVDANIRNNWLPQANASYELMASRPVPLINIPVNHLYAVLLTAALLALLGFGVLVFFYAIMYSAMGPSRYGPLDAPPLRSRRKKKKFKTRR